ncbi:MAG TPA: heavy metal sensor histidine kinase [Candidatus Binatia bacterium]|nr:heavy metal sensor histidine kinase [Candidatus Binatia bacterium]
MIAWGRSLSVRTQLTLWYSSLLLVILILIGALSYRVLAWSLTQDLDASLGTFARVLQEADRWSGPSPEDALRDLLGPEMADKLFQLLDPMGRPGSRSSALRQRRLPLSAQAWRNAARGERTVETVVLTSGERVRVLTMPVLRGGTLVQLIQVGIPLARVEDALRRYLQIVLALGPVGVLLAAGGGAGIARVALRPVREMARTARRITAEDLAARIPPRGAGDELDYLAETLNGMLARLEGAFDQMRRFNADAAHELRTPLTVLKGEMEVALRSERSPAEYRRVLGTSLEEVERLIKVSEDLLLLARAPSEVGLRRARVDLEPLVLEALDAGVRLASGAGVSVSLGQMTPAAAIGDGPALRRAMLNLVENAVKYTLPGGRITLSLGQADGLARIVVEDTGIGIDAADQERIFEPFVRLDEARSRETGGSGLGLAIARSIVVAHGGHLDVQSAPKAGSRFTIELPAV